MKVRVKESESHLVRSGMMMVNFNSQRRSGPAGRVREDEGNLGRSRSMKFFLEKMKSSKED